ncbi:MAG: alanine/ornithine racemase family PLP-dependent enzyme [Synergistaceae bacterium]|jgi:predicted amino acid racemase|nr:alanine/ornithine racemase family PLP-dependent enzyme [Synergistaceae bacterium]
MMKEHWPRLILRLDCITENASRVVKFCASKGVEVAGVVKGVCADLRVAGAMLEGGCASFADSRLQNLKRLKEAFPQVPRTLLRIPMKSELEEIVRWVDSSLVSMPESVEALDDCCKTLGMTHKVILMFDLGDRREGILLDTPKTTADINAWPCVSTNVGELESFVAVLKKTPRVVLQGVGVNFGCFAGVLPSASALRRLCLARETLASELGYDVHICSGGSTSSLALLERGELPSGVNHLRVGEAILLGQDVSWRRSVPWLRQDTAYLEAEVVEARVKPSLPEGETGADAFGNLQTFEDKGPRRRAIVAIGRQDVPTEALTPYSAGVQVLGGSSDHTILDVTDASVTNASTLWKWGDKACFSLSYAGLLGLMTSPYVFKDYRN